MDEDVFIMTTLSSDKRVTTRISHVFYLKGKAIDVQKCIVGNYKAGNIQAQVEAVPEELEVFDCLYLGSTQLPKATFGKGYKNAHLKEIFTKGIDLRKEIFDERSKLKLDRLHIEHTMMDIDGDGSPEAVEEHPVVLVMTNRTFRITDSITGKPLLAFLTSDIEHVDQLPTGIDVSKEEGVKSTWDKTLVMVTNNKMTNFISAHHFFPLRADNSGMVETIKDIASRAVGSYADLIADGPFAPAETAVVARTPESIVRLSRDRTKLTAVARVAAGDFGEVWETKEDVKDKKTGSQVVVRRAVKTLKGHADDVTKASFVRECKLMVKLGKHKNICRMTGVVMQQVPWLRVIEYAAYGDLKALMANLQKKKETLMTSEYIHLMRQMAAGGAHIAKCKIVHMDLNARNILVAKKNSVKICDFDQAQPFDKDKDHLQLAKPTDQIAAKWAAPEIFNDLKFSEKSDVFALGVTFWEMFSHGASPWPNDSDGGASMRILAGERLPQPVLAPPEVWTHLSATWAAAPSKRPTFAQLGEALKELASMFPKATGGDIGMLSAGVSRTKDDVDYESDDDEYVGDILPISEKAKPIPGLGWAKLRAAVRKGSILGSIMGMAMQTHTSKTIREDGTVSDKSAYDWGGLGNAPAVAAGKSFGGGGSAFNLLASATSKAMNTGFLEIKLVKASGPFGFGAQDAVSAAEKPLHEGYPTVYKIGSGSIAQANGFQVGDLVCKVNGKNVKGYTGSQVHTVVRETPVGHPISFRLKAMSKRNTGAASKAAKIVAGEQAKAAVREQFSSNGFDDGVDPEDGSKFGKWAKSQKKKHFEKFGESRTFMCV